MNGKVAKMLRRFKSDNRRSKQLWLSIPPIDRGKIRVKHKNNKSIDYLFEYTQNV